MATVHITTPEEFLAVFNSNSAIGTSSEYEEIFLDNDIDFADYLESTSILSWRNCNNFSDYYHFDGGGFSIKNLVITTNSFFTFFYTRANGWIKNLKLDNCHITSTIQNNNTASYFFRFLGVYNQTTANATVFESIVIKGNCSFTSTYGTSQTNNPFYAVWVDDSYGANVVTNKIGISGNYKCGTFYGLYVRNGVFVNVYMNALISCYIGALARISYNSSTFINMWNRSTITAGNEFVGIVPNSSCTITYCYSYLIDDNSTGSLHPITTGTTPALYEALFVADYTPASQYGVEITQAELQSDTYLRGRGWLI